MLFKPLKSDSAPTNLLVFAFNRASVETSYIVRVGASGC